MKCTHLCMVTKKKMFFFIRNPKLAIIILLFYLSVAGLKSIASTPLLSDCYLPLFNGARRSSSNWQFDNEYNILPSPRTYVKGRVIVKIYDFRIPSIVLLKKIKEGTECFF